jgi:predicted TIM-barrel enzyme
MVTHLKTQPASERHIPHKSDGKLHKTDADHAGFDMPTHGTVHQKIEDAPFTEQVQQHSPERASLAGGSIKDSHWVARGKDLLANDAGSVATAAAIVVGAALIEVELIPGLIIGAGAILLGKLFPEIGSYVRPVVKSAVRAGFSMSQKAREVMAEATEQVHDLVAEVKHEQEAPPEDKPAPSKKSGLVGGEQPVH